MINGPDRQQIVSISPPLSPAIGDRRGITLSIFQVIKRKGLASVGILPSIRITPLAID